MSRILDGVVMRFHNVLKGPSGKESRDFICNIAQ